jgi:hypothetical protein
LTTTPFDLEVFAAITRIKPKCITGKLLLTLSVANKVGGVADAIAARDLVELTFDQESTIDLTALSVLQRVTDAIAAPHTVALIEAII